MQIQITAVSDPALIAAAARHGLRRPVLTARLAGWAFLLLAVLLLVTTGDLDPALTATGAALAVLVPVVLLNRTAQSLRAARLTTYEISEGGVASSDAVSRHAYAWRAFRSVEQLSGQLLFSMRGARFLPVPTAGLSAAEIEQVLGAASAGGLRVRRLLAH
ncbi:YcxB family protein [Actinoplanes sp. NEAU-A12]|uniref:YcxB family protein n=1 Tax=Actinoplanes sandaracinus TaxID=3045177 RepID=A0ABT6WTD8_9ACTN|nr:YcxB family protein [Actinoplanes sandaracinus]MDI6099011.1 YcxB family protein [Actinoplanes sandaracinus]MDI6102906.1 YcxB family protein [Actinoplanes sandaracinus]